MSYTVTLTTTDSATKKVATDGVDYVLTDAAEQNIVLPAVCHQGSCGTCVATITSGEYEQDSYSPDALGPTAARNDVLLCRTKARSDMTIDLPYDNNRIINSAPPRREGTITTLEKEASGVIRVMIRLVPDAQHGSAAEFDAGQYVQLERPGGAVKRAYSMANVNNWDGDLEFYIHPIEGGAFTGWLANEAQVGDIVSLYGPQGGFGLWENGLRPRWFVGGGTGMSQLLAMLRRMAEWGDPQPTRLFVGVTTPEQLFGTEEIAELADKLTDFEVDTAIWKCADDQLPEHLAGGGPGLGTVSIGTAADILTDALKTKTVIPDVYVCGPPALVNAVEATLAKHGVTPSHVLVERIVAN